MRMAIFAAVALMIGAAAAKGQTQPQADQPSPDAQPSAPAASAPADNAQPTNTPDAAAPATPAPAATQPAPASAATAPAAPATAPPAPAAAATAPPGGPMTIRQTNQHCRALAEAQGLTGAAKKASVGRCFAQARPDLTALRKQCRAEAMNHGLRPPNLRPYVRPCMEKAKAAAGIH